MVRCETRRPGMVKDADVSCCFGSCLVMSRPTVNSRFSIRPLKSLLDCGLVIVILARKNWLWPDHSFKGEGAVVNTGFASGCHKKLNHVHSRFPKSSMHQYEHRSSPFRMSPSCLLQGHYLVIPPASGDCLEVGLRPVPAWLVSNARMSTKKF